MARSHGDPHVWGCVNEKISKQPRSSRAPLEPHPKTPRTPNTHCQGAWRGHSSASSADPKSAASPSASNVSERLLRLSERSAETLSLLPNRGRPVVGRDGLLREYRGVDTSELPDPGHRHWSGLWALYPGSQVRRGTEGAEETTCCALWLRWMTTLSSGPASLKHPSEKVTWVTHRPQQSIYNSAKLLRYCVCRKPEDVPRSS